jgi:hypothetical protein
MQQTLPTYRHPRVAPYNPQYENPRYVAPIPPVDPWARPHYAGYSPQPMQLMMPPQSFAREFDFRPRRSKRRGLWIGVGMAVALVALVIALVVTLISKGHSDSASDPGMIPAGKLTPEAPKPPAEKKSDTGADETELDQLVEDFRDAADIGPASNWLTYYCSADRAVIERAKVTTVIVPSENFDRSSPLIDVEVTGKRARGELNGGTIKFRKESGDWKFCMTT